MTIAEATAAALLRSVSQSPAPPRSVSQRVGGDTFAIEIAEAAIEIADDEYLKAAASAIDISQGHTHLRDRYIAEVWMMV